MNCSSVRGILGIGEIDGLSPIASDDGGKVRPTTMGATDGRILEEGVGNDDIKLKDGFKVGCGDAKEGESKGDEVAGGLESSRDGKLVGLSNGCKVGDAI